MPGDQATWQTAASWLFVPGDRADRFDKAVGSGADMVILDLEDAVAPTAKSDARRAVTRWLAQGRSACVRINPAGTPYHDDDVSALTACDVVASVMVPKAEDPDALAWMGERLPSVPVVALVETAVGIDRARDLAAALAGRGRLAFGSVDFSLDIGAADAELPMLLARSTLVLASRVAALPPPVDSVTTALDDLQQLEADARRSAALGFTGKLCVHPRQVPTVNQAFTPDPGDVERARRVLAAVEGVGALAVDGEMVDRPVIEQARRTLARVRHHGRDIATPASPGAPAGTPPPSVAGVPDRSSTPTFGRCGPEEARP